jgi:hypothetical protein
MALFSGQGRPPQDSVLVGNESSPEISRLEGRRRQFDWDVCLRSHLIVR